LGDIIKIGGFLKKLFFCWMSENREQQLSLKEAELMVNTSALVSISEGLIPALEAYIKVMSTLQQTFKYLHTEAISISEFETKASQAKASG
jgi:hypothetical protein